MMKIIVKPLFTQFKSITIELSFIFNKIKSYLKKSPDFRSTPKMSGFLQNNVKDPDFLELWTYLGKIWTLL